VKKAYRFSFPLILVCFFLFAGTDTTWAQCAMCRTALTEYAEGQQMARGFNDAILFLLVAPYLVFGTLAATLWSKRRRASVRIPLAPSQRPLLH
jgi:hypothetical protein